MTTEKKAQSVVSHSFSSKPFLTRGRPADGGFAALRHARIQSQLANQIMRQDDEFRHCLTAEFPWHGSGRHSGQHKRPDGDAWQNKRYTDDELCKQFRKGKNVGLLLGPAPA